MEVNASPTITHTAINREMSMEQEMSMEEIAEKSPDHESENRFMPCFEPLIHGS